MYGFNTQPPEGGWASSSAFNAFCSVSTHSRLKAAGNDNVIALWAQESFNTQPPEGGWLLTASSKAFMARFNTQPPEGGWPLAIQQTSDSAMFQHTAA